MTEALKEDDTFEYRVANEDDATGIFAVLQEVAPEIPVTLDTPERQEIMQGIIAECCDSGESWVAIGADGTVVGFVLAKPDRLERFLHKNEALSLPYVGVTAIRRQHGIFGTLMEKLMAKAAPPTATVLHGNHSGMADRFAKIGFTKMESDAKQVKLKWEHGRSK
jgi:N-acetylglutamate synthase-like GNAT family acetyltransferase